MWAGLPFFLLVSDLWHNKKLLHCLSGVCEELFGVQALPGHILVKLERSTEEVVWKFSAATLINTLQLTFNTDPEGTGLSCLFSSAMLSKCRIGMRDGVGSLVRVYERHGADLFAALRTAA